MKKRNHQSFRYPGRICITNINNRDFYVHQGISLKEYIVISIFLYDAVPPPVSIFRSAAGHSTPWAARGLYRTEPTPTRAPERLLPPCQQRAHML